MSLDKRTGSSAYHCCDQPYRLAAFHRADKLRSAERARLVSAVTRPTPLHWRGAALLGGGMMHLGRALVRLGGSRLPEAGARPPVNVPLNLRLLQ